MKLNINSIDQQAASSGVWIDYTKGIRFRIARFGNKGYTDAMKQMYRVHKRAIDQSIMSDEDADDLHMTEVAKHLLVGWEGLTNDGKEFPYSVESAKKLLLDPQYIELRQWVFEQAKLAENFRTENVKK